MNFQHLDFLIYSSHKTSTQSLISILRNNRYNTIHCHKLTDLSIHKELISDELFIKELKKYKQINNKKLKIISIIRNPNDRLISSFFQSFHTDEVQINKKNESETTIMIYNINELVINYSNRIKNSNLPGNLESINEIQKIFNINLIKKLRKHKKKEKEEINKYYINNDLFELYILDYNKLISENNLDYINNVLNIKCINNYKTNLSKDKIYYNKYKQIKKKIPNEIRNIIESKYNLFFFNAFT